MPRKFDKFQEDHNVRLIRKDLSWTMQIVGLFFGFLHLFSKNVTSRERFIQRYWTTFRLPFQKPTIAYAADDLAMVPHLEWLRQHELHHANDMRSTWGLFKMFWLVWLLPLPAYYSGRWFIERHAYLIDIRAGVKTPESSAEQLWNDYFYAWPKDKAIKWFNENV